MCALYLSSVKLTEHCLKMSCAFIVFHCIPFPGHSEMEGEVMSQVRGGRDNLCDNLPTTEPLTAQTGNLNETSALSQNLSLLQKGESGEQGLFHNAPFSNTGRSRDEEEEEEEGNAEGNRDHEEEDLDELMKEEDEEEEDVSEGSSSIICCQSPDTPMTDSSYSETGQEHTLTYTHNFQMFSTVEELHCNSVCVNVFLLLKVMQTEI